MQLITDFVISNTVSFISILTIEENMTLRSHERRTENQIFLKLTQNLRDRTVTRNN